MLIPFTDINTILQRNNIQCTGALHIGAHDCEELPFYSLIGILAKDVIWIDAIRGKVKEAKEYGIPNVYTAVITDQDDTDIRFNISNNVESSSIFEFGTHADEHPSVVYVGSFKAKTITIDTFFERNGLDGSKCTFWNFDIQGAELLALKGATKNIQYAKAIYLEVNETEVYKGCGLIEEIDSFLSTYNFNRVLTHITEHGWGDALYIKKD